MKKYSERTVFRIWGLMNMPAVGEAGRRSAVDAARHGAESGGGSVTRDVTRLTPGGLYGRVARLGVRLGRRRSAFIGVCLRHTVVARIISDHCSNPAHPVFSVLVS